MACNVQSSLLDGLMEPSVEMNGTLFVGVVDPDVGQVSYLSRGRAALQEKILRPPTDSHHTTLTAGESRSTGKDAPSANR